MMPTEQAADRVKALVEQLRIGADDWSADQLMDQAADALTALQARVGELEGALKPFAEACAESDEGTPHDNTTAWETGMAMGVTYGDFRRARALLTPPAPHSDGER